MIKLIYYVHFLVTHSGNELGYVTKPILTKEFQDERELQISLILGNSNILSLKYLTVFSIFDY